MACVVFQQYAVSADTEYRMKERNALSITDDDFNVKNNDGETIFKVDAKVFSLRGKRQLKDVEGNVIWTLQKKVMAIRSGKWALFRGDSDSRDDKICEFEPDLLGNSVEIEWSIDDMPKVKVDGNIVGFSYDLEISKLGRNTKLAEIRKQFRLFRLEDDDPQAYAIEVKEGADAAFVFAVVTAVDEARNDADKEEGRTELINTGD